MSKPGLGSVLYLVACLVTGTGVAIYLWQHGGRDYRTVPVLARNLQPYTPIRAGDLMTLRIPARHASGSIAQRPEDLIGRYGLALLQAGRPVEKGNLGPGLPAGVFENGFIIGVPLGSASGLNARIMPGSRVGLVFQGREAPPPITSVYVLNVSSNRTSVVLSIPVDRSSDFGLGLERGFLIGTLVGVISPSKKPDPVPSTPTRRRN